MFYIIDIVQQCLFLLQQQLVSLDNRLVLLNQLLLTLNKVRDGFMKGQKFRGLV